jgi:NTP pyrophosphatase (non-canonical NTP hydrolase)
MWTDAEYSAVETGAIPALIGDINIIVTPRSGLDEVYNSVDGVMGRAVESDAELRIRATQSLELGGAATVEAIRSRLLQEIEEALHVLVFENITDATVDNRPPHSFEVVVDIADDEDLKQEVADVIWAVKPAGVASYGSSSKTVVDSQGYNHIIYFSRPTRVPIYVIVNYTRYDEETFPLDGEDTIENKVLEYGISLGIGVDVIPQRFFGGIFENVPGIENLEILVGTSNPPTADNIIPISSVQISQFEVANITINDVTP